MRKSGFIRKLKCVRAAGMTEYILIVFLIALQVAPVFGSGAGKSTIFHLLEIKAYPPSTVSTTDILPSKKSPPKVLVQRVSPRLFVFIKRISLFQPPKFISATIT